MGYIVPGSYEPRPIRPRCSTRGLPPVVNAGWWTALRGALKLALRVGFQRFRGRRPGRGETPPLRSETATGHPPRSLPRRAPIQRIRLTAGPCHRNEGDLTLTDPGRGGAGTLAAGAGGGAPVPRWGRASPSGGSATAPPHGRRSGRVTWGGSAPGFTSFSHCREAPPYPSGPDTTGSVEVGMGLKARVTGYEAGLTVAFWRVRR